MTIAKLGEKSVGRRRVAGILPALLLAVAACLAWAVPAMASEKIQSFDGMTLDSKGNPEFRAGAHPFSVSGDLALESRLLFGFVPLPFEDARNVDIELPAGFVGNPTSVPTCPPALLDLDPDEHGEGANQSVCPSDSQVGIAHVTTGGLGASDADYPLYNVEPPPGVPAEFGFNVSGTPVIAQASVRSGGDYGISLHVHGINQTLAMMRSTMTFWGVPADPAHDGERGSCLLITGPSGEKCPSEGPDLPFLSNPTSCQGPLTTTARVDSWQAPGAYASVSFVSHDNAVPPNPVGISGCANVPFSPTIAAQPSVKAADAPSGMSIVIKAPDLSNPTGLEHADLKRAVVTLPQGVAVNPSSANGLGACLEAQVGLDNGEAASCPDNSKIGAVEIDTPLLRDPVKGGVYLAQQYANPFDSLLAVYLIAESKERGVVVKLPGKVETDQSTGQLRAIFDDNPQLPFRRVKVDLFAGPRAPLTLPATCGENVTKAEFSPWSAADPQHPTPTEVVTSTDSFSVGTGPNGGPCASTLAARPFGPGFTAGVRQPVAGSYSPFVFRLTRPDGNQELSSLKMDLPAGLLANLSGIPYCSDAALAAISMTPGTGASELGSPSCPAGSQIGTATVGAGSGSSPIYVQTGRAYLAGPYKGAPLSIAAVVPALAGPFDLGSVVVRNQLVVNPETARVQVVSDPMPQILSGIPLRLRDVRVSIDRPDFVRTPTSCNPMSVDATMSGAQGAIANVSDRFQVASCERLQFKPSLQLSVKGATHRSAFPALKAVLTMPRQSGANIQRAQVTLPRTELLEQAHIRTICTRVQYAAGSGGGSQCPAASIYGKAKAWTPLLDKPLEGPVYLRSSNHQLPDLVASLNGQIHIDLVGRIDAVNARIRNTFEAVPDAPVSKFVLEMQGGKKGLLANNTELCQTTPRASVGFDAQNGKVADSEPVMRADCGKGRKGKRTKGR